MFETILRWNKRNLSLKLYKNQVVEKIFKGLALSRKLMVFVGIPENLAAWVIEDSNHAYDSFVLAISV